MKMKREKKEYLSLRKHMQKGTYIPKPTTERMRRKRRKYL